MKLVDIGFGFNFPGYRLLRFSLRPLAANTHVRERID
jgi:hypothetical protein